MKHKIAIEIALDQTSAFDISIDRKSLVEWNSGYSEVELISGIPGEEGAIYKLTMSRTRVIVNEKIISVTRPYEYISAYTTQGMTTNMISRFIKISENITTIVVVAETKSSNPLMVVLSLLMYYPTKWIAAGKMKEFKVFAEKRLSHN
jgi:hypothetical protein